MSSDLPRKSRTGRWIWPQRPVTITIPAAFVPVLGLVLLVVSIFLLANGLYSIFAQRPFDSIATGGMVIGYLWLFFGRKWLRFLTFFQQTFLLLVCSGAMIGIGFVIDALLYHKILDADLEAVIMFSLTLFFILALLSQPGERNKRPGESMDIEEE